MSTASLAPGLLQRRRQLSAFWSSVLLRRGRRTRRSKPGRSGSLSFGLSSTQLITALNTTI